MLGSKYIRVLYVDLSSGTFEIKDRPDLVKYLGGVGIATKLLDETLPYQAEPLAPEQPIIFAIGPLSTIFPVITKTVCMFRSPLTGELGESYAGGRLAMAMRYAGYDALVITGKAKRPVYLSINSRSVSIKKADPMWGTTTEETGRYLREVEAGRGFRSIVRIGQAGEKQILFAGLNVDTYRHFGRLGAGALFGSKQLKALVITGDRYYDIPQQYWKSYRHVYADIYRKITETEIMEKYHDLGTPGNILKLNAINALPTRNLQSARFEKADELSGESFAEERLIRKVACIGCPIGCIHIGQHRRLFGSKSHEYETYNLSYDHELIFALGTFLGMQSKDDFFALLERVEAFGLDAMSTGVLLGWLTEAYKKGLVSEEELGTRLDFGYVEGYLQAVQNLIQGKNELYRTLAKGTEAAAARYGGQDFAMTLGGHEMTGYHTGYGAALGQAVGARHSHLDNAGYAYDQTKNPEDIEEFVSAIFEEEVSRCVANSMIICLFARGVYDIPTLAGALNSIGMEWSEEDLHELGRRIYRLKLEIKRKMGFDFRKMRFPRRFFETPSYQGVLDEGVMREMLERFVAKAETLEREVPID